MVEECGQQTHGSFMRLPFKGDNVIISPHSKLLITPGVAMSSRQDRR